LWTFVALQPFGYGGPSSFRFKLAITGALIVAALIAALALKQSRARSA
jgi:hypothetical protein